MKRAAIITAFDPYSFRGGIETYTVQLRELLNNHNVKTDIYHTGMVNEYHRLHNEYLGRIYLTGKKVLDADIQYDMVIANSFYGLGYFPPKAKAYNIFHLTHKGFAEKIRDVVPRFQYLEWKYLWGEFAESVSGFQRAKIAVSESVREELGRYYGFSEVEVLYNGVDIKTFIKVDRSSFRRKWGIPAELPVGLYVGRWDILKGCDVLESVMKGTPEVFWVVVLGTGSDRSAVPVLGNVKVIEQVPHENMRELYSAADFMLFPSRYEGFGYVVIEAMACGLPVITTDVGIAKTIYKSEPFRQLLLAGGSGGHEEVILSALSKIERVRRDNDLVEYLTKEGRRLIEEKFDVKVWEREMLRIVGIS